ncbi:MAG: 50S ribosomal protein L10 [Microgenomates group bacterium GW2011_GWA1_48_10]|nr:MAG: 50S ribosomal protein L10 [Microgenomates group bacterium GW2011_GWA1_48_10]
MNQILGNENFLMPKQKNIQTVENLKEKVQKAKSLVVADYRGLTHKQAEELHHAVKKVDGEFIVVKNRLLQIATDSGPFALSSNPLSGPSAVLLSYSDDFAPLKELYKTIKALNLPVVKFGFISGKKYSDSEVGQIAKLPGQDVLRTQVVSRLSSPMYGLLYTLNGNLNKLVYVLSQIKR